MKGVSKFLWILIWLIVCVPYIAGLFLDVMDIDAAQYAAIAKEMFYNGSYLEVYLRGSDYLDKPPLLFWLGAFSFHVFGVHDWAFRLPSLLVTVLGIYSTFRFARLFYSLKTAQLAALLVAACQAFFLMNHDVRTDALLTGFVMFTFWQMAEFDASGKIKHIVLVGVGIGLAMLSKGPIGLVVPGTAFFFNYLLNREWSKIFRWQYVIAGVVIAIILFPMCYGLYNQYDLHPEKTAYELQGPSGLRFFFWTQSFGRITGEIYWDNNPDTFYLVHNFIWSFLPWSGAFFIAFFVTATDKVKSLINGQKGIELITLSGFLLILIFLSMSKYQLPHYTFVIHPLAAIIFSNFICNKMNQSKILTRLTLVFLLLTILVLIAGGIFLFGIYLKEYAVISFALIGMGLIFSLWLYFKKEFDFQYKLILPSVVMIAVINIVLNSITYPQLFTYQSDSVIARYVNNETNNERSGVIINYKRNPLYCADFYYDGKIQTADTINQLREKIKPGKSWVVVDSINYSEIENQFRPIDKKVFYSHAVSMLNGKFLNPETRKETLKTLYLLKY